jgi:hypothetical protein
VISNTIKAMKQQQTFHKRKEILHHTATDSLIMLSTKYRRKWRENSENSAEVQFTTTLHSLEVLL